MLVSPFTASDHKSYVHIYYKLNIQLTEATNLSGLHGKCYPTAYKKLYFWINNCSRRWLTNYLNQSEYTINITNNRDACKKYCYLCDSISVEHFIYIPLLTKPIILLRLVKSIIISPSKNFAYLKCT